MKKKKEMENIHETCCDKETAKKLIADLQSKLSIAIGALKEISEANVHTLDHNGECLKCDHDDIERCYEETAKESIRKIEHER